MTMHIMRYLAIDLGDKRTGLATGDSLTRQAGPVGVIETSDTTLLLQRIREAIDEHGAEALVVGIAYNMDGSIGPAARKAEALAMLLERHSGLPVHRHDERLTTFQADEQLRQTGLTHRQKKARRDALAAAAILTDFLNAQPPD